MKRIVLLFFVGLSLVVSARDRDWKDAIFLGISTSTAGVGVMPVGTAVVAMPLSGRVYWVKSEGIVYALRTNYTGRWPNLTVNGHTKVAVERRTLHLLDEDGKDRKFSIIEKIAPKPEKAEK